MKRPTLREDEKKRARLGRKMRRESKTFFADLTREKARRVLEIPQDEWETAQRDS